MRGRTESCGFIRAPWASGSPPRAAAHQIHATACPIPVTMLNGANLSGAIRTETAMPFGIPPMTATVPSFQDLILRLHGFWARQGCVILQPYDVEMGAGTFHPATTLRALGPKPWRAAYVQPSRRPADGRYGENPNRLQHYYQYQVIMKPSPIAR